MKVFVYYKNGNDKFATFKNVERVEFNKSAGRILIYTEKCGVMELDTTYFKTTIYQN